MRSEVLILWIGSILLLLPTFAATADGQPSMAGIPQTDSIDIAVMYQTVYPGTDSAWLEVWMDNPDYSVAGFQFMFTLSSDVVRFCEDDTGACIVDTTGGIAGALGPLNCWGGGGWAQVSSGPISPPYIEPYPGGYQLLFKLCMYSCCVPDSATERFAAIYMTPGGNSFIADENGELIPFRYHQGEVSLWWSLPGDANSDSLVNVGDIVFLLNFLYQRGPEPCVCEAADANADCVINVGDIIYLINYLFVGGPPPKPGCPYSVPCPHEGCRPE